MAIREDLVSSAITFLQDPSVGNAPLDKRVAFLQSKNLTQEEIDVALTRTGATAVTTSTPQAYGGYQQQRQQPATQWPYQQYPGGFFQPPPPELPRRDWRDYFIMATVTGGLGYGLYLVAKACLPRYIAPLIAPPTPPQLTADKASIDASFTRAFALIDTLASDTATLKSSEESRTTRLDAALNDMESAIADLKLASRRRDDDARRVADDVHALHALVPKSVKAHEDATDARLKELGAELRSLKTLVSNRMAPPATAAPAPAPAPSQPQLGARIVGGNMFTAQGAVATPTPAADAQSQPQTQTQTLAQTQQDKPTMTTPYGAYGRAGSSRGGIPAWQLAAAKKTDASTTASAPAGTKDEAAAAESGTASAAVVDGAGTA